MSLRIKYTWGDEIETYDSINDLIKRLPAYFIKSIEYVEADGMEFAFISTYFVSLTNS